MSLEASWNSGLGSGGSAAFILAVPPPGDGTSPELLTITNFLVSKARTVTLSPASLEPHSDGICFAAAPLLSS